MKKFLILLVSILVSGHCFAAAGDERIAEMWQCKLEEGKTMEELQANNSRWLTLTRKEAGSDDVRSYALQTIVGDITHFLFVDTYPNMAAWSAAKSAEDSEEGKAIEAAFDELMKCEKNRLYTSTEH
jgi:hypothetical protein